MANFIKTGYLSPGVTFTVDGGGSAVSLSDTLVLNGTKLPISEWVRTGVIRFKSNSGNVNTYHLMANPEIDGQQAGAQGAVVSLPTVTITAEADQNTAHRMLFSFSASSALPAGSYVVEYGDSSSITITDPVLSGLYLNHTYSGAGSFTVTFSHLASNTVIGTQAITVT